MHHNVTAGHVITTTCNVMPWNTNCSNEQHAIMWKLKTTNYKVCVTITEKYIYSRTSLTGHPKRKSILLLSPQILQTNFSSLPIYFNLLVTQPCFKTNLSSEPMVASLSRFYCTKTYTYQTTLFTPDSRLHKIIAKYPNQTT